MPRKLDTISIKDKRLDRRVKLTDNDRVEIQKLKGRMTQSAAAKMYNVSRRIIQFIWFPEQLEENKRARKLRGGSKQYYNKEKHRKAMKEHREYKKKLFMEGLI